MYGVVNVVMAEAPTATGNRKSLITPNERPNVATIKANSPICAMLIPTCTDCLSGCPDNRAPRVVLNNLPNKVKSVIHKTGQPYWMIAFGSIIIPTETKNTAPKRSFTGLIMCSTFSADVVSAIMEPMIKAPNSAEKPTWVATTTMPRHSPIERINKVSSSNNFFTLFKKVGKRKIPARNHKAKKKSNLVTVNNNSVPSNSRLTAIVDSNTMSKITTISSTTSTPKTTRAYCLVLMPNSSKARMIIVVDELASIPPRNRLSMKDHPISRPSQYPVAVIKAISTKAVIEAAPPTRNNFLKLNSSPRLKRRKITPISASVLILSLSITDGVNER